jgi:hypothetical protein
MYVMTEPDKLSILSCEISRKPDVHESEMDELSILSCEIRELIALVHAKNPISHFQFSLARSVWFTILK